MWPLVEGLGDLPVLIVDDGPEPTELPSTAETLRTNGECGFSVAVNLGLEHLQRQGFGEWVLVLNDDARIDPRQLAALCAARADDVGVIAPVICQDEQRYGGVRVRWWGRVLALDDSASLTKVDAVWGCCMLIPSWARFRKLSRTDLEDINCVSALVRWAFTQLCHQCECQHLGAGSLECSSAEHRKRSVYGHLLFLQLKLIAPVILALSCLSYVKSEELLIFLAVLKGFRDWAQRTD